MGTTSLSIKIYQKTSDAVLILSKLIYESGLESFFFVLFEFLILTMIMM